MLPLVTSSLGKQTKLTYSGRDGSAVLRRSYGIGKINKRNYDFELLRDVTAKVKSLIYI